MLVNILFAILWIAFSAQQSSAVPPVAAPAQTASAPSDASVAVPDSTGFVVAGAPKPDYPLEAALKRFSGTSRHSNVALPLSWKHQNIRWPDLSRGLRDAVGPFSTALPSGRARSAVSDQPALKNSASPRSRRQACKEIAERNGRTDRRHILRATPLVRVSLRTTETSTVEKSPQHAQRRWEGGRCNSARP